MLSQIAPFLPSINELPALWIRRFVLIEKTQPFTTIRDFDLHPGVNLVVGESGLSEDKSIAKNLFACSGHSVGKTTWCRLMRHLLGERSFGTKKYQDIIEACFPDGWVAGEVLVHGQVWAVAKPLSTKKRFAPKALLGGTIETLFDDMNQGSQFEEYTQQLENLLPPFIKLPDYSPAWAGFFAWLSRDQECRLRDYWAWREPKTNSGVSFPKSVEHPKHLVRGALQLLSSETQEYEEQLAALKQKSKQVQEECDNYLAEPRLRCIDLEKKLRRLISAHYSSKIEAAGPLFSFESQIESSINKFDELIKEQEAKLPKLDSEIAALLPTLLAIKAECRALHPQVSANKSIHETTLKGNNPSQLEDLLRHFPTLCPYSRSVKIADCQYVQKKHKKLVGNTTNLADAIHGKQDIEEQRKLKTHVNVSDTELQQKLNELQQTETAYDERIERRGDIIKEVDRLTRLRNDAKYLSEELIEQKDICEGHSENIALLNATIQKQEFEDETKALANKLEASKGHLSSQSSYFNSLFSALITSLFGDPYSGRLVSGQDLDLQVHEDGELAGSVVETLAILLADITAMLSGCSGHAHHPGFLLHDSPREADLSPLLYEQLLLLAFDMSKALEATGNIPFQYIITTTTMPPQQMNSNVVLRLTNSEDGLLFKKTLQISKENAIEQTSLI